MATAHFETRKPKDPPPPPMLKSVSYLSCFKSDLHTVKIKVGLLNEYNQMVIGAAINQLINAGFSLVESIQWP